MSHRNKKHLPEFLELYQLMDRGEELLADAKEILEKGLSPAMKAKIQNEKESAFYMPNWCVVCGKENPAFGEFCSIGCQVRHYGE